jgi:hypothetical protein
MEGLMMTTEKRLFDDNSKFIKEDFNKRLIRLDHALRVITPEGATKLPNDQLVILLTARKKLKNLPTADAVEVVQCKDCKHGMKSHLQPRHAKSYLCRHSWEGEYHEPDHFCSYGERKDNAR